MNATSFKPCYSSWCLFVVLYSDSKLSLIMLLVILPVFWGVALAVPIILLLH